MATTCERPIARDTGPSTPRTAPATNQVSRLIATRLATAPRAESTARAGAKWTIARSRAPSEPTSAWPAEAATSTPPTSTALLRSVLALPSHWLSRAGSSHIASAPPPRKPTSDAALISRP